MSLPRGLSSLSPLGHRNAQQGNHPTPGSPVPEVAKSMSEEPVSPTTEEVTPIAEQMQALSIKTTPSASGDPEPVSPPETNGKKPAPQNQSPAHRKKAAGECLLITRYMIGTLAKQSLLLACLNRFYRLACGRRLFLEIAQADD